jgi:hypothetical protein
LENFDKDKLLQLLMRQRQEDCEVEANLGKVKPYLKNKIKALGLGAGRV